MVSAIVQRFRNDVAPRLLEKFGNGGVRTVIRVLTGNVDPLLPPTETLTPTSVNAFVSGVSSSIITGDANLVASDLLVRVAAIDYTPEVGAIVEINGANRAVIRVDAIPAAGDPAIYRFFLR